MFNNVKHLLTTFIGEIMLGVRLSDQLENRLNSLSEKMQRSRSFIAKQALERYISEEELKEKESKEVLSRWENYKETGEVIGNEVIEDWLDSWGTDKEKACPSK